jgi:hypothetical protein
VASAAMPAKMFLHCLYLDLSFSVSPNSTGFCNPHPEIKQEKKRLKEKNGKYIFCVSDGNPVTTTTTATQKWDSDETLSSQNSCGCIGHHHQQCCSHHSHQ